MSIVEVLKKQSIDSADKPAFIFLKTGEVEDGRLTYGELYIRSGEIAKCLLDTVPPGSPVLLVYPSGLEFICAFFACLRAGIVAVPVPMPRSRRSMSRFESIVANSQARLLLTDLRTSARIEKRTNRNERLSHLELIVTDALPADAPSEATRNCAELPLPEPESVAFVQYTSGSTREPRGVAVRYRNLDHNLRMLQAAGMTDANSVLVSWLPMFHDMGLVGKVIHTVYVGARCVILPPESFIQRPERWLQTISRYRGTFSLAPNFAYAMCVSRVDDNHIKDLDLKSWRLAGNGAEPVRQFDIQKFCNRYRRYGFSQNAMAPCYGLAEATLFVCSAKCGTIPQVLYLDKSALRENKIIISTEGDEHSKALVSCGSSQLDQSLVIVDPLSRKLMNEDTIGEIWVAGGHIPCEYWGNDNDSDAVFRASDHDGHGPYLRTGDLGFLHDDELYITGRLKDVIIIYGRNYYPQDIELSASLSHSLLRADSGAAFALDSIEGTQLVIVHEVEQHDLRTSECADIIDAISSKVAQEFEISVYDICLLRRGTLMKTSSGKVQRQLCKALYVKGALPRLASLRNSFRQESSSARAVDYGVGSNLVEVASKGLFGMQIPRTYGGLELSNAGLVQAVQDLAARDLTMAMYLGVHHAASYTITHYASESVRQRLLPKLASGEILAAFALTEPEAGSNPNALCTRAFPCQGGWKLTGKKAHVGHGQDAGVITVFARQLSADGEPLGVSAFLLLREFFKGDMHSVSPLGMKRLRPVHIDLQNAFVANDLLLGETGQGMSIANDTLRYNRLGVAAMCAGALHACLQKMEAYASERRISTGKLIDNPVTRQRLDTLRLAAYTVSCMSANLAHWLDEGYSVPHELFMSAKTLGAEYLWRATDQNVQLHGYRGYEESHPANKLFRDARAFRIIEGPTEVLNHFLGVRILESPLHLKEFFAETANASAEIDRLLIYSNSGKTQSETLPHEIGRIANYSLALAVLRQAIVITDSEKHEQACSWLKREIHFATQSLLSAPLLATQLIPRAQLGERKAASQNVDDVTGEHSRKSIEFQIRRWVSGASQTNFTVEDIDPARPLSLYGVDSIMAIELSLYLQQLTSRHVDAEIVWQYPTAGALATYLAAQPQIENSAGVPCQAERLTEQPTDNQVAKRNVDFSLFFFSSSPATHDDGKYRLLIGSAKYADNHGFRSVWIPERHFHDFGGLHPSPSTLAAALAMVTEKIRIRTGSVVLPLHNPIKVAEEWAVADNLSNGRIDLGFAAGWNANDFIFSPHNYADRIHVMYQSIDTIRRLWQGEAVDSVNGHGEVTSIRLHPLPVQRELSVWITCSGGVDRFIEAGSKGENIITALLFQTVDELVTKIAAYRKAREDHGHNPVTGKVTLMLHTFVGDDMEAVKCLVREPFIRYLECSIDLWRNESRPLDELEPCEKQQVLDYAFERYFNTAALFGTPQTLISRINELSVCGVDEIACLIDFGIGDAEVLNGLERLHELMVLHQSGTEVFNDESHAAASKATTWPEKDLLQPLSANQKAVWFLHKLAPQSHAYDVLTAYRLPQIPDIALLQETLNQIAVRHPLLVSGLVVTEHGARLKPGLFTNVPMSVVDADKKLEEVCEDLKPETFPPFRLEQDPLFQVFVYRCSYSQTILLLRAHHLVTDFWSAGLIAREIQLGYHAASKGIPLLLPDAPSYFEFSHMQQQFLMSQSAASLRDYWRTKLGQTSLELDLPYDVPAPKEIGFEGHAVEFLLPASVESATRRLAEVSGTTLFTILMAAFAVFLKRYTHQEEFLIGIPVLGRDEHRYWRSVGYFANVVAVHADLANEPDFFHTIKRLDAEIKAARSHELPFFQLVESIQPQRRGRLPVIQVMLDLLTPTRFEQMIKRTLPDMDENDGTCLPIQSLPIHQQLGQFELSLEVTDFEDRLSFSLKCNSDLFHLETVHRMAKNFTTMISAAVTDTKVPIGSLPLISESELALIQQRHWKKERGKSFIAATDLFYEQVKKSPDKIAINDTLGSMSYRQLESQSNQVAHSLLTDGIQPGSVVAVQMERSAESLVAIIGILKAGCAYLPLDVEWPDTRVAELVLDSKAKAVFVNNAQSAHPSTFGCKRFSFEQYIHKDISSRDSLPILCSSDIAYVMYTSGSTGKPKGVRVTHGNMSHLLSGMLSAFDLRSTDTWTLFHSLAFDFSVWEIWGALVTGANLVIASAKEVRDPQAFHSLVQRHCVSILNHTPGAFSQFIEVERNSVRRGSLSLRMVILSGEQLSVDILQPWFSLYEAERPVIYNMYGITETTVFSTFRQISPDDLSKAASPIGESFDDSPVFLLDSTQQPVPLGVIGEIHVGGGGVALDYLGRPDLTQERMKELDSLPIVGRVYKTGDLARMNHACVLEYIGRSDRQVKIRGYRIELAEIETALNKDQRVRQAFVHVKHVKSGKQLVAYVVADKSTVEPRTLLDAIRRELPRYMVPSHVVILDNMPLTTNGKIDVGRLPEPTWHNGSQDDRIDDSVAQMADIWQEVLGTTVTSKDGHFFELGGDSLALLTLSLEIEKHSGKQVSVSELLQYPYLHEQAQLIRENVQSADKSIKWGKRVRNLLLDLVQPVLVSFLSLAYRLLMFTVTIEEIDRPPVGNIECDSFNSLVIAHWHGDGFLLMERWRKQNMAVLSSMSRVGRLGAKLLRRHGFKIYFGSQRTDASMGLQELAGEVVRGGSAALAVDGSHGPIHMVKRGIVELSRQTQRPILCVAGACSRSWTIDRSWDKAIIPKPFSRVVVKYGASINPLRANKSHDDPEYQRLLADVERGLQRAKNDAEALVKEGG